jgi:alpha-ketoglutaric semialdehyde dehydrogenase
MTELTGLSLIAGSPVAGNGSTTNAIDPSTGQTLTPDYTFLDETQVEAAVDAAKQAFASYRATDPEERAAFLETIASNIEAVREPLVERAMAETGLPSARLTGEVGRTVGQLRTFAEVVRTGNFHASRIDPAQPDRTPAPRLDIRQRRIPVGPVVVFGASNFPLAFSVAGGDTASALAAGCPVIVKAHNAHPGTGEIVGRAITEAVAAHGLNPGVFSLVFGSGASVGQQLVSDPRIAAVGFTGSRSGGLALQATAQARQVPIPVYAEMSSINPVILLNGALTGDGARSLAEQFITSLTGSSGQLCTAPGLVLVPNGSAGDAFAEAVGELISQQTGQTMLTPAIAEAFDRGVAALAAQDDVSTVGTGTAGAGANAPAPIVFTAASAALRDNEVLSEEIFGAASVLVRYDGFDDLLSTLAGIEGQLTTTIHATEADTEVAGRLLPVLEGLCGRILFNGWPTGVEVGHAMVHGGPFPATSAPATTSVGTLAIDRFLRPVSYQAVPAALLPKPIADDNPWSVVQTIDGVVTTPEKASALSGANAS